MAKFLNKDPVTYQRERAGFIRELQHFHETRGTPFKKIPKINGHEIDLYLLYVLVTAHGGWVKVNIRNEWEELIDQFPVPKNCVNNGVALKQVYLRYLDRYEKVHFLGEDVDRGSDDDEDSRHKRWSARALHSVPLTYNHHQHNVAESLRTYNGLSANLYKPSDYDRLALSLMSPLPNEQDFAMNVCTLLSNEGKHTLKLEKCPRIVNFLLAHAGVFNHESLRGLFDQVYRQVRRHSMLHFWPDTLTTPDLLDLVDERNFGLGTGAQQPPPPGEGRLQLDPADNELFCLGRSLGTQDCFGQRVLQVATILRNLSFVDENVPILGRNATFLRFLLLCASSRWNSLHQLGLDMLGNVAAEVPLEDPVGHRLSACLLRTVTTGLASQDRLLVVSCLEVLNRLSQKDANEEIMLRCLEQAVYNQVCSYLTLHDIMLLIYTLECLYSLSSLGERACNCIVRVHGAIDTLVSLITVEAQSYGPKACILMRVVETVSGAQAGSVTTTTTTSTAMASGTPTTTPLRTVPPVVTPHRQITPHKMVIGAPQPAVATPVTMSPLPPLPLQQPPPPPPQPQPQQQQYQQQQQHAHQQAIQENEQFALGWLRTTFEPSAGCRVEQGELYKQYLNAAAKMGRRGVIAPLHFPRCVRSVFGGSVGPVALKSVGTPDQPGPSFYEGIKVRIQQLPRNAVLVETVTPPPLPLSPPTLDTTVLEGAIPAPASPILKAQLSAPPKPRDNPKADGKSQVLAHPHLTQALLGSGTSTSTKGVQTTEVGNSTSLIKSLLATKVNPGECMVPKQLSAAASMMPAVTVCATTTAATGVNQPPAQVTQRQQQQRLLQQQLQSQKNDSSSPPPLVLTSNKGHIIQPVSARSKPTPGKPVPRTSRINGARVSIQSQVELKDGIEGLGSGGPERGRREPPQPPPPPLAPLSSGGGRVPRLDVEDSDSTGNNSLASSSGGGMGAVGGLTVSTDDGENSLTSFEGFLLNGATLNNLDVDAASSDSNSKDSARSFNKPVAARSLMLADLLEKKTEPLPALNGVVGKELRIGEKGLELVENHREEGPSEAVKRPAEDAADSGEAKRPHLAQVNGTTSPPVIETPSSSAANLYAALAADALEDEPDMEIPATGGVIVSQGGGPMRQVYLGQGVETAGQQLIVTAAPRQIIVSQGQLAQQSQVLITAGGQITLSSGGPNSATATIKTPTGHHQTVPVLVQTAGGGAGPRQGQVMLSQSNSGQLILSSGPPQGGQYLMSGNNYVVAQPQTALVQGQTQTVLVAQTPQQQGTGAKTIIILQPQQASTPAHQKVVVTPQGQPVVVTQVPRPILQSPAVSNTHPPALVPTSSPSCLSPAPATPPPRPVVAPTPPPPPPKLAPTPPPCPVQRPPAPKPVATHQPLPDDRNRNTKMVQKPLDQSHFLCEWRGCMRSFRSANEVYMHACEAHCPSGSEEIQCLWERCDAMKRKRFSLMTHLYDRHCNADVLRMMAVRRKQLSQSGRSEIPPPQPPPPHPGYAPNAAFHAIKRHALEFVNPKEMLSQKPVKVGPPVSVPIRAGPSPPEQDDNEGPVTKSIRLTSSLILRNLVIYSTNGRRFLRSYEPHLASVALSNVESSRTIAQVLWDMNEQTSRR